ncbi:MAG: hypothetical protein K6G17_09445 [Oscillospiraceae bacterium]|nr:hypothetical protein [Oscillospiraceae bacterium]
MKKPEKTRTLISISKKTFIQVTLLLFALLLVSVALTYVLPKGEFGRTADGEIDYLSYLPRDDLGGLPLWRGLLAPVLVFFSGDGLTLAMLSLFLFVISAAFQAMNDVGGIRALVGAVSERFRGRGGLLLLLLSFLFYCFGAFLGLFEEMLTMLPIVAALCLSAGYDSFTGFICCILSCGFGFAGAITNPFTVLLASEIIGVNPMEHIGYRVLIFFVMFLLLAAFLRLYVRRLKKDPGSSLSLRHDEALRSAAAAETQAGEAGDERRCKRSCAVFLLGALALIVGASLSSALRGYTVVILTAYFLFGGVLAGVAAGGRLSAVLKSFLSGLGGALPTIVFIALAASVKFVLDEGAVLPTLVHQINRLVTGRSPVAVALVIYLIVLLLEFFISSSTAKAILVMGLLAVVNTGLTKPMLVLLYTFADGYTNVLFPTSPVLLISLSMVETDYFTWVKKSFPLFLVNFLLVVGFIVLGVVCGY